MPAEPNAPGSWRKELDRLEGHELVNLCEELDEILDRPVMQLIRRLLIGAHDELVGDLVRGPIQPLPIMAKRTGLIAGLEGLDNLVADIRAKTVAAEKRMQLQLEKLRREEVRP